MVISIIIPANTYAGIICHRDDSNRIWKIIITGNAKEKKLIKKGLFLRGINNAIIDMVSNMRVMISPDLMKVAPSLHFPLFFLIRQEEIYVALPGNFVYFTIRESVKSPDILI
jgi:hypothetical protein